MTMTSIIQQPLKAVTGGMPQSHKAVISTSKQLQQLEQIQEDLLVPGDPVVIDPHHRVKAEILQTKSLSTISSCKEFKPVDEEESKCVVKKHHTSSDLPEEVCIPQGEVEEHPVAHSKWSTTLEVDPDGDWWDGLEADDPLMVS